MNHACHPCGATANFLSKHTSLLHAAVAHFHHSVMGHSVTGHSLMGTHTISACQLYACEGSEIINKHHPIVDLDMLLQPCQAEERLKDPMVSEMGGCLQTFKGDPQEFGMLEDAVQSGLLEVFQPVQHRASGCWMPFWLSALMQSCQGAWRMHVSPL